MDDRELMQRLASGEADALRLVYETHKDHLLTVAFCLLLDRGAAEDALHDVFVSFAGQVRRMEVRTGLRAYLAACVANRARDELRRRSRRWVTGEAFEELKDSGLDPLGAAILTEDDERLEAALAELPFEQREVVVLHLQADMTFNEVAQHQQVSIHTVQSRYRYGISRLRSLLQAGAHT